MAKWKGSQQNRRQQDRPRGRECNRGNDRGGAIRGRRQEQRYVSSNIRGRGQPTTTRPSRDNVVRIEELGGRNRDRDRPNFTEYQTPHYRQSPRATVARPQIPTHNPPHRPRNSVAASRQANLINTQSNRSRRDNPNNRGQPREDNNYNLTIPRGQLRDGNNYNINRQETTSTTQNRKRSCTDRQPRHDNKRSKPLSPIRHPTTANTTNTTHPKPTHSSPLRTMDEIRAAHIPYRLRRQQGISTQEETKVTPNPKSNPNRTISTDKIKVTIDNISSSGSDIDENTEASLLYEKLPKGMNPEKPCPRCKQRPISDIDKLTLIRHRRKMKNRRHRENKWKARDEDNDNKTVRLPWSNTICAIVGHSFIKRLKQQLEKDVNKGLSWMDSMDLSRVDITPHLEGISGATINNFPQFEQFIDPLQPEVVLIEIGTNDICGYGVPESLARKLMSKIDSMLAARPYIYYVVWCQIIPRLEYESNHKNLAQYNIDVGRFNKEMIRLAATRSRVFTWRHSALESPTRALLSDGIHPDTTVGFSRYLSSIIRIIKWTKVNLCHPPRFQVDQD